MDEWKVIALSNEKENKVYQALKDLENPADIGTVLMYHVVNRVNKEDRVAAIKSILERLASDTLSNELPKGELERIRKIIDMI